MSAKVQSSKGKGGSGGDSFIQRIFSIFAGMGDPDSEKKKLLKSIGKDLARSKFKFFKPKGEEALPGLAKFFYELYKTTAPAQLILGNATASASLRSFVIESYLTEGQRQLVESLTEESIVERSKALGLKELQEEIKGKLTSLVAVFDGDTSRQVDSTYNTLLSFVNFVSFDYYFLLKKFDSSLAERSFGKAPRFDAINGEYVADDLADFLEVFLPLDMEADWRRIFEVLKTYRNSEIIQADAWMKLVPAMAEVKKSQVLEQIVRHVKRDPAWGPMARYPNERIVEPYLQKLKAQTETLVQRIIQERRNARIDEVAKQIFGTTVVLRMKNYTEKANVIFAKKMMGGYIQAPAMNYLKAYLIDYFKKDIREIVDILIIRGQWTTNVQMQQLSDAYHALLDISDQIIQFDDSLSDDGEMGSRIKGALMKSDRDKEQVKYLRNMLKDVNERAYIFIAKSGVNLITIGRQLKALIEDYDRPHHEVVLNWKEIEGAASRPVKEWLVEIYKKIYYMVQLLQYYTKDEGQ
jgi:regulator of sigma D